MREIIDIYDANLVLVGQMDRREAHVRARWHRTYHCWVLTGSSGSGSLLFQRRSAASSSFPGCLDVSAAGHLRSGERAEDGIREVREELGIEVDSSCLYPLGYRTEVFDQDDGQKNREYQAVYLLRSALPLAAYRPSPREVAGLYWLDIESGVSLFTGRESAVEAIGITYNAEAKTWTVDRQRVTIAAFVPRITNYYLTIFIMAERLLEGRLPIAVS